MTDESKGFGRKQSCPTLPVGDEEGHGNFQHIIDSSKDYNSSYRRCQQ
jgi:hypothetical protein